MVKRLLFAAALCAFAGEVKLGKPLTLSGPTTVAQAVAQAPKLVGKTVQVRGKVTEVCQMMGCWMALRDIESENALLRVKVNDGDIVFPKDGVGRVAVAEGKMVKIELTRDQAVARARHEAEEQRRPFDPKSVRTGETIYQIQGTGAVLER
jgi:hypothetical protein